MVVEKRRFLIIACPGPNAKWKPEKEGPWPLNRSILICGDVIQTLVCLCKLRLRS